jgi:hypothetical protein
MSVRRIDDRSLYRGHALPAATGLAGTAHGPAVDLKPRAGAATGGYLMIDQPEANVIMDEMERENAINPITMERPELRASVFRVEARTPKPDGSPRYSYWDPAELWRWLRQPERQGRMPDTNEPIWFEDWWALYYTYGAPFVPDWAYSLEKRDRNTRASASVVQQMMAPGQDNTITPSDGRLQALSQRNRYAARAARPRAGLFAEDTTMETDEEANARADLEEAEQARRQQQWDEWQSQLRQFARTPEEDEAFHLAAAEEVRNRPPNPFGDSNESVEAYHRQQAALAAARRASANTPPNPFGSM